MDKILTVSIAAYNVEKYIRQTLDSLCVDEVIDYLEVFVVDDGGKDNTLAIAKEYASKFPNSIVPVHKENGGWGSTVNYSIAHASGKYFRLLDGDDYYDREGLVNLVNTLKDLDVDVVYTPYRRFDDASGKTVERFQAAKADTAKTILSVESVKDTDFVMHSSTFRTALLKKNKIQVLEHCFYTDNEYRTKAMAYAKTAFITDYYVYEYRVGREGQSVDLSGLKKHYKDNYSVLKELVSFYQSLPSGCNKDLTLKNLKSVIAYYYNTLVLLNLKEEMIGFDREVLAMGSDLYEYDNKMINSLRTHSFKNMGFYSFVSRTRNNLAGKVKMLLNRN